MWRVVDRNYMCGSIEQFGRNRTMGGGYSALVAQKAIDRRSRRAAHVAPIYTSGVHQDP